MKKKILQKNELGLRLAGYAASAGVLTLVGSSAQAQIIHSGPQNIELNMPSELYELDLDGDLVNDFVFYIYGSSSFTSSEPYFRDYNVGLGVVYNARSDGFNNSWVTKPGSIHVFHTTFSSTMSENNPVTIAADLAAEETLNSALSSWTNETNIAMQGVLALSLDISYYYGSTNWGKLGYRAGAFGGETHFIGTRFYIGAEQHYGWIRVSMGDKINPLTILDWAYEANPGVGLTAGEGGDLEGPVVSLMGAEASTTNAVITLAVTMNEVTTGLELNDFQVSNGTALNLNTINPGSVYTVDIQAAAFGTVSVQIGNGAVTDRYGNENSSESISWEYIDSAVNLKMDPLTGISIFPNPVNHLLNIELEEESSVELINLNGKCVYQQRPMLYHRMDVRGFSPGIYIVQISNEKQVTRHKVVIE